jgi:hypothetical protein
MGRSLYTEDPDEEFHIGQAHPAWSIPKTELARQALTVCGKKYFAGQRKANSEFEEWDRLEQKAIGATEESYLFKRWILECIEWAKSKNRFQVDVRFVQMMHLIENNDKRIDTVSRNRNKWLTERRNTIPSMDFKKGFESEE